METRRPPSSGGISRSEEKTFVYFGDSRLAIGIEHRGIMNGDTSGFGLSILSPALCNVPVSISIKVGLSQRSIFDLLCNSVSSISLES